MAETGREVDARLEQVVQLTLENWDSIGVVEGDGGILHLPVTIKKRNKAGGLDEQQVLLRRITTLQESKARTRSREWAKRLGLDLDRDKDLIENLEKAEILAFAIRGEQFEQHVPDGESLVKLYDPQSLDVVYAEWEAWTRMLHPSFGTWKPEELWQIIARVRAGSNLTPLAVMPGRVQASCVLFMAMEACNSPNAPSWLQSSATLTREP